MTFFHAVLVSVVAFITGAGLMFAYHKMVLNAIQEKVKAFTDKFDSVKSQLSADLAKVEDEYEIIKKIF